MVSLSQCKKADVLHPTERRVIKAAVSIGPLESLLITVPKEFALPVGEPIQISFLDSVLGVVLCSCQLSAPLLSDDRKLCSYRCQVLEKLSQEQRREDIKISHTVQVTVKLAGSDTYAPATVQNISAGGVYLTTSMPARKGNQLTFDFPQADGAIPLTAEVLRVELRPPHKGRLAYGYGCRFVRLSSRHEAQLRSYVFKLARR